MGLSDYIIMRELNFPDINRFERYCQVGGWEAYRTAVKEQTPATIVQMVKEAGLRGRGGAGFPTGIKWSFLPKDVFPRYLLCNCDESEPGTFNNHQIIDRNPHQLIEGVALSAYAIECHTAYIYMRGEFAAAALTLEQAIDEAYRAGLLGKNILGTGYDLDIYVHRGAGAYICGEETALMESLEGKIGQPRLKPPFPAVAGLYGKPTIINNVETLANVPRIVEKGVAWYRSHGTEKSPGTKCFSLSGHVNRPGNYELPFGVPLRDLIESPEYGGGMKGGRPVKIIIPGGASAPWLTAKHLDVPLDYEGVAAAGSMLGSGAVIVLNDTVKAPHVAYKMDEFFKHESCGKCTPCREGTHWLVKVLHRLAEEGHAEPDDIPTLHGIYRQMAGNCFCLLGESAVMPIKSALELFPEEFEAIIKASNERHQRNGAHAIPLRVS
ncbi:NADH-quinone oxidoreductase subunit NuoF [Candidatus Chloroploca sp. M-50]|uniref:NADH-quinone oxidoreductase subunit F n=1 Tax=Candidatus Chloroploca mongolica TaxID=2528176 RepID=A0ABS4DCV4_9CHLR|nr:NADH-quinone oxidoreductase subunit NuoF [Candidatus Chloroploca mongolica]MBP1467281.1 NADH-quinone oxidoreductase subunit NuoF [Candidatus Chloroploca mongolica]